MVLFFHEDATPLEALSHRARARHYGGRIEPTFEAVSRTLAAHVVIISPSAAAPWSECSPIQQMPPQLIALDDRGSEAELRRAIAVTYPPGPHNHDTSKLVSAILPSSDA